MRIALVHPYAWPDVRRGGERYLDDLAWYLAGAGHDVDVLTGTDGPAGVERRDDGATVRRRRHVLPGPLARRGVSRIDTFGLAAWPALARRRYDMVHAFTPSAAIAGRLAGHRVVYSVLGHPTPDQFGIRPGDRALVRRAIAAATLPVALSAASARAVGEMFGRPVDVLPPGVRTDRFACRDGARQPRILFSGDAGDPRKGLGLVLDAFEQVRARRPEARLVLSGPGDPSAAIDRFGDAVEALGIGPLDGVAGRYRDAAVTVLPSRYEAFGLALVESLACGTPAVCLDDGGMPEIVGPPEAGCGRVVAPGDMAALARAIDDVIELACRPGTAQRCAARAARWDWAAVIGPRHVDAYRSLVNR